MIAIFSALENCLSYSVRGDRQTKQIHLVLEPRKCLHLYHYFQHEELGLCHVRVPTWLPCRLQICFNGHSWLAGRLRQLGIDYRMADNAFSHIADWQRAQRISNGWEAKLPRGRTP